MIVMASRESWDQDTGRLTLSGTASVADYQAALRSITYNNRSESPDTGDRTLRFVVNDGLDDSDVATSTITVAAVNDAPETDSAAATIDEDTPYIFSTSDFAFSDVDEGNSLQSIQITALPQAGRLLLNGSEISTGADVTRADLLSGRLRFEPGEHEFGDDYASFGFRVSDGELQSDEASFEFSVTSVNDAPVVSAEISRSAEENADGFQIDLLENASDADTADTLSVTDLTLTSGNNAGISHSGNELIVDPDAYDYLPEGEQETITYTYNVEDGNGGSASQTVTLVITGTNDSAIITGSDIGSVTEESAETLTVSGALAISDEDTDEASFTAETITGTYGSLTIDAEGNWSYEADNSQTEIQELGDGDSLTETLTVQAVDGTNKEIVITINGTNDAAQISGDDSGAVTEDSADTLTVSGALAISDTDADEDSFTAETVAGTYGSLTIDEDGNWSYEADNNQAEIQALGSGDTLTDTLTVQAIDGTTHEIIITINGTNDDAQISGDDSGTVTEDDAESLTTSGVLSVTDTDSDEASFTAETVTGTYGSLTIDAEGNWSYSADNNQSDVQSLGDGDQLTDRVTVRTLDGTTREISITINGTNDAAQVSGDDSGSVAEDAADTLTTSGVLSVTDTDSDEASFTAETITGTYGSLTIDADGSWSYEADNTQSEIQSLGDEESLTDTLTVQTLDGTTREIAITINGSNDAAQISGDEAASLTEDSDDTLTASGSLSITDTDADEASFASDTITGTYGSLTIDSDGNWSYEADNGQSDIQALGDGDQLTDTLTVRAVDGTTQEIVITINGTNDVAQISGDDTGSVTEDSADTLTVSGSLSVTDTDSDESSFTSETITGTYGSLTIDADGNWSYEADNNQTEIQTLGDGETLTDTLTVRSTDGTTQEVVITINGINDAAVIEGDEAASVTEDSGDTLTTSGALSVSDTDSDEASFTAETITGTYGSLTIDAEGNWSYEADNSQTEIQALGDGDTLTDTLTVQTADGTTSDIVITINGTNDVAQISGDAAATLTEDSEDTLTATGVLSVTDTDSDESSFTAETVTGTYGSLTIDADGNWSYEADNSQNDVQALGEGDQVTDTLTVRSVDGTAQEIVITITGTNDEAQISGDDTRSVTEDDAETLTTSGTLSVTDTDTDESSFTAETITGTYGSLTIDAEGNWSYEADNSQTEIQELGDGDTLTDTLTVQTADGTTQEIVITINGTNDAAQISGDEAASVTEDSSDTLTANGALTVSDDDADESSFTAETVTGTYGSLTIDAEGNWSYEADNSQTEIQELGDGDTLTDTLTVQALDGTTKEIVITINGTNDAAQISGDEAASITEDSSDTLTVSGTLSVTDTDSGESNFTAETITGTYGSLTIDADGNWSYEADNAQNEIQALSDGNTLTDTLAVRSTDGTTKDIVITINGANDAAIIEGDEAASVTEDNAETLTASGVLTISDTDSGEASFTAETIAGTYGSLTIDADGNWSYSADNDQTDIQALGDGDTLNDTLTVRTADGTTKDIVITINGTNDIAVIEGDEAASLTEDDADTLTASGALTVSDTDSDESSFTAETITGTYGSLTIDAEGNWTYEADNNQSEIQALGSDEQLTDTLTIRAVDGTTKDIAITINGTNDVAQISGDDTGSLTEENAETLTASGVLSISDTDTDEASFTAETVTGTYGTLTIGADGNWSYEAENSQAEIQALGDGDSLTDTLTVSAVDGTTQEIVITINGTNDTAQISGDDAASITEDSADTLTISGALSVTDTDSDESNFTAETVTGTYGSLSIDAEGSWSYEADNSQTEIQALGDGDSLTDTLTVRAVDGTTQEIVITINGTNDVAQISGDEAASVTEDSADTLTASGTLSVTDTDSDEDSFTVETVTGTYGSLTMDAEGNWSYEADNSQTEIQELGDGESLTDTLTISTVDGSTKEIVITINGTNDAAQISGNETGSVTEDSADTLTASGALTVSDDDSGEASFTTETITGTYGSLTIDAEGNWSYEADNSQTEIQALGDGDTLTDTLTVSAEDGTTQEIVITISGTNDVAQVSGDEAASITEDSADTLTATGTLSVTDVDSDESSFTAETITGTYGSLIIDAEGNWSYEADNSQTEIQALGDGDTLTDTLTVQAVDGTTQEIVITINGTNDAAQISGDEAVSVTEDSSDTLTASGALAISDDDSDESSFTAETITGTYGSLTIDADGNWSYEADNSQTEIQELGDGDTLTDTLTVQTADGTTQEIVITINGTNDAAQISGDEAASVTEDSCRYI